MRKMQCQSERAKKSPNGLENAIDRIFKDSAGQNVVSIQAHLNLDGSVKSTRLKLTWLPDIDNLMPLSLFDFDYLITKKKVEMATTWQML